VLSLFGVAASSSFQTSRDVRLSPGQSTQVGDYTITYERPYTQRPDGPDADQKIVFGSVLTVSRDGERVTTLNPSREYHSGAAADPSAPIQSFFEGEATSEVGRDESLTKDLWSSMQPDLATFDSEISGFDERYAKVLDRLSPEQRADPGVQAQLAQLEGQEILRLTERYERDTPPADIRFNVNPFVIWFWLGVIVAVGGALFALWPTPEGRRRRVSDVYGARLARELTRV
jgi:cytochrome c-type biogenesis protein CcmF